MSLFDAREFHRKDDPPTSKEAAAEIAASVGHRAKFAYGVLKENQGCTANELDRIAGTLVDGKVRKRLPDLRKLGFARTSGFRTCTVTKRRGQLWWTTGRPESELDHMKSIHGDPPGFEEFWQAYPRKTARKNALIAFARLSPDKALVAKMIAAIDVQKATIWSGRELLYVPHPATWINGERWNDEVPKGVLPAKPHGRPLDGDLVTEAGREAWSKKHPKPVESELAHAAELLRQYRERHKNDGAEQGGP